MSRAAAFIRSLALPLGCIAVGGGFCGLGWAAVTGDGTVALLAGAAFAAGLFVLAGQFGPPPPRR